MILGLSDLRVLTLSRKVEEGKTLATGLTWEDQFGRLHTYLDRLGMTGPTNNLSVIHVAGTKAGGSLRTSIRPTLKLLLLLPRLYVHSHLREVEGHAHIAVRVLVLNDPSGRERAARAPSWTTYCASAARTRVFTRRLTWSTSASVSASTVDRHTRPLLGSTQAPTRLTLVRVSAQLRHLGRMTSCSSADKAAEVEQKILRL